jgi:hypothetical protein
MPDTCVSPTAFPTSQEIIHRSSDVLDMIAGPWSAKLAEIDPFPHQRILGKPSCILHSCGLVLAHRNLANTNIYALLETSDWREAAWLACPKFDRDAGNLNILKKLSLPLWNRASYIQLVALMDCPNAVQVLNHQQRITPDQVAILFNLPTAFRRIKIVDHLVHFEEAKLIARLVSNRSETDLKRFASGAEKCKSRPAFWRKLSRFFFDGFGDFSHVIEIDHERFETVRTSRRLIEIAKKYDLCCNNYVFDCFSKRMGFLVYHHEKPVIISYVFALDGSPVVDEYFHPRNRTVDDELADEISSILMANGFNTGLIDPLETMRSLDQRLHRLASADEKKDVSAVLAKIDLTLEEIDRIKSVG